VFVISPAGSIRAEAVYRTLASRSLHDPSHARLRRDLEDHTTASRANVGRAAAVCGRSVQVPRPIHDHTRVGIATIGSPAETIENGQIAGGIQLENGAASEVGVA
jgi:hypothetical protein